MSLASLRRNYARETLSKSAADPDPIVQFAFWFEEALSSKVLEPNAMTLATADADGQPSARIVLLKEFNAEGFVFYTNYDSRKGRELAANPRAALLFCWLELERQVRIEGTVEKVSREESEKYFHSRPKDSQIGAWVSPQSQVIEDRKTLEIKAKEIEAQYAATPRLPLPAFWGGYRLVPQAIEFWQGRESRLHDRLLYTRDGKDWRIERLAP